MKITKKDVTVSRHKVDGSVLCETMANGHLVHKRYYFYSKRDALESFVQGMNLGRVK